MIFFQENGATIEFPQRVASDSLVDERRYWVDRLSHRMEARQSIDPLIPPIPRNINEQGRIVLVREVAAGGVLKELIPGFAVQDNLNH